MTIYNINSNGSLQVVVESIDNVVAEDVMKALKESNPSYNLIATEVSYEHPYYDFETSTIKERSDKELMEAGLKIQPAFTKLDGDTLVPIEQKSKYHEWNEITKSQVFNVAEAQADCYAKLKSRLEYILEKGFSFVIGEKTVVLQPVRMTDMDKLKIFMNRIGDSSNIWYFDNGIAMELTSDQAKKLLKKMENAYSVVNQSYFFIKGYIRAGLEKYLTNFDAESLDEEVAYLNEGTK